MREEIYTTFSKKVSPVVNGVEVWGKMWKVNPTSLTHMEGGALIGQRSRGKLTQQNGWKSKAWYLALCGSKHSVRIAMVVKGEGNKGTNQHHRS